MGTNELGEKTVKVSLNPLPNGKTRRYFYHTRMYLSGQGKDSEFEAEAKAAARLASNGVVTPVVERPQLRKEVPPVDPVVAAVAEPEKPAEVAVVAVEPDKPAEAAPVVTNVDTAATAPVAEAPTARDRYNRRDVRAKP